MIDVSGRTLLQCVVPDAVLSSVFGLLEGAYNGLLGIGVVLAPLLIAEGSVEVTHDGRVVGHFGRRDLFGEIALLRGTRRNATVTAISDCRLFSGSLAPS